MRALGICVLLAACGSFDVPAQPAGGAHPHANAGTGSSYPVGATVTLDGSGSFDPDGTILEYGWSIVQKPSGSAAVPADPTAATTTLALDEVGTYHVQLRVTDDSQHTDESVLRIVSTGAITSIDAGPDALVSWLGTAQLSGTVTTLPGKAASYRWELVSRPPGSIASLNDSNTLTPTFFVDAAGTYILSLQARVGDEVREDTMTVEASATGVSLGTGNVAYTYSEASDHILYVRDVGYAEIVKLDPMSGEQTTLNIGTFAPRSISIDWQGAVVAVGGPGRVATVAVNPQLTLTGSRSVPGCTAAHVTIPYSTRVDCFPVDGTVEPISSVNMTTGEVTQVPCPVQFPAVTLSTFGRLYMVDGASPQFYVFDANSTPPLKVLNHGSLAGIAPPVIAAGTNDPFAVTGNGLAVNLDASLRFDLQTSISAGAFSGLRYEIAVGSASQLKVFGGTWLALQLTVTLPPVNGEASTVKLVAYSADERRIIVVAGTAAGDFAYTVPR